MPTRREFLVGSVVGLSSVIISSQESKQKFTCCQADTYNRNEHIYPRHVLEQVVTNFKASPDIPGQIGMGTEPYVNLKDISHTIKDMELSGNDLIVEIEVLNTPEGKKLQKLLRGNSVEFRTAGVGNISSDGVVSDFKLVAVNAVLAGTGA